MSENGVQKATTSVRLVTHVRYERRSLESVPVARVCRLFQKHLKSAPPHAAQSMLPGIDRPGALSYITFTGRLHGISSLPLQSLLDHSASVKQGLQVKPFLGLCEGVARCREM